MSTTINAKELRGSLPKLVARVRMGARFVVTYRSRPAFQIVPVDHREAALEGMLNRRGSALVAAAEALRVAKAHLRLLRLLPGVQ
jgi:prevent-host-death family protein